jgi:hypothetical protein
LQNSDVDCLGRERRLAEGKEETELDGILKEWVILTMQLAKDFARGFELVLPLEA